MPSVVIGDKALLRALTELPKRVQSNIERKVLRAAATPISKAAKANLAGRKGTGTLRKSIGIKIKKSRKDGVVTARIGPRRGFAKIELEDGTKVNATRYAHLVEKGHGGPHPAPAYPFLEPALQSSNAGAIMQAKLSDCVQTEAAKLAARR